MATRQALTLAPLVSGSVQPNVTVSPVTIVPAAKASVRLVPTMAYVVAVPIEISGP